MEPSDMSFSVSLDEGKGCEWGSRNGLSSLFAQKMNVLNPYFWQMIIFTSDFAVILKCWKTTQMLITMKHWDSSSTHGVTLNYFRRLIWSEKSWRAEAVKYELVVRFKSVLSDAKAIGFKQEYEILSHRSAGMVVANGVLGKSCSVLSNPKHMVPSLVETGALLFVTRFLGHFISTGCVILLEEGGTMLTSEGTSKKCSLKTVIKVHNPHFYWKRLMSTKFALSEFDSLTADFHCQQRFYLFQLKTEGWWTPLLFTAGLTSAKHFFKHVLRQNTLTQARRNISRHYDLSNDLFALFLDETMTYSCAVFKTEDEDLKDAQHRKISLLIEKARIDSKHEILEIGYGWGSLAIEVVKRTGCKYTGITLSEEQLKFAETRVKEAGLQGNIRFQLCDYRQLPNTYKYDRIISCEMIEAVGHEYMEEFFGCSESVLAEDGLLVLQFISIPEERYDEYRRSSDFIKEYIFPGGCLPSLTRITSAMSAASRLCVEHVENIGLHYYQTLRYWRKNFLEKQSLKEEVGTVLTFKGNMEKCCLEVVLKVQNPQFYWKIMTEADLGLADAYIHGDFTFEDKEQGLLNLFLIFIANRQSSNSSVSGPNTKRGWWAPALVTASISSAKYFLKHVLRQNTLAQARRNISRHYDLSNELFELFMGETMLYSTAIFKAEDEDLNLAQLRKVSSLIDKARIEKGHEVLEIGSGWGFFAIEVVKRTGCKYTGLTLSQEQLKYAEAKVKEAGLQDKIKFLLCDYRQLPKTCKYDRIITVEMIEHVGNEYIEEFFKCCESILVEDGLFILQFISLPEKLFHENLRSQGFVKEYIFHGGCLLSLNRILSAMAATSRLSVEHVENIGPNYFQTLKCWRKNFLENQSKILALGFDEKFMRTWEYYFDYTAAGFKSRTLGNYQVVFSRSGNFVALADPYQANSFESTYPRLFASQNSIPCQTPIGTQKKIRKLLLQKPRICSFVSTWMGKGLSHVNSKSQLSKSSAEHIPHGTTPTTKLGFSHEWTLDSTFELSSTSPPVQHKGKYRGKMIMPSSSVNYHYVYRNHYEVINPSGP
ncbi:hypothetical protein REPUB_Repub15cG0039400 [Reevesia pubescens]